MRGRASCLMFAVLLAGCASGRVTPSLTPPTPPTSRVLPPTTQATDDWSLDRSMLITQADVPPGWTSTGQVHVWDPRTKPTVGIEPCFGTLYDQIHQVAALDSPSYLNPTGEVTVSSAAWSYDSPAWVNQDLSNLLGPKGQPCVLSSYEQAASILQWTGTGLTLSPPPPGSPTSLRVVEHLTYTNTQAGRGKRVSQDTFIFASGRYEARLDLQATGSPIPATLESQLTADIARRLPA